MSILLYAEGCNRNIGKKVESKECLIYIANEAIYVKEEEKDMNYNKDQDFIDILKNSIMETDERDKRKRQAYLINNRMYNNWNDLIEKGSDILLGIDEKVRRCLENSMKNLSNRKRIDEEYFIEMLVIEKFLKEEDMKLDILGHSELEDIEKRREEIRKFLELMKKENFETY
ncbi:hypothetical protein RhiirC2_798117 [Rhizophagus irregularis]|uniref:Uncharacterized protein n=1 Tax=Rhizophagus irregularis TaxID=588596 RepID=A0A2N1M6Z6_9GLOM|nr:hypothetical protein RhiirC2_798117 [Rhizophagus irregularis]